MKKVKFSELEDIIKKVYGIDNLNENTCINKQRTLSEDNNEFIRILVQDYNVNMEDFKYYDYFEEDEFILLNFIKFFLSTIGIYKSKKKKLKLSHILKVINLGKWVEDFDNTDL